MENKILLVDISISGHRMGYIDAIRKKTKCECLLPYDKNIEFIYYRMESEFDQKRNIINYIKFIREINRIVKRDNIEIVHILCGDAIYKFFGLGLNVISVPTIITFHHMSFSKLKKVAIKNIFKNIDIGVVHTNYLFFELKKMKIDNIEHIEYPVFGMKCNNSQEQSRNLLDLPYSKKILTVMGGTQRYKGLDILLEALNYVNEDFYLFICGPERDFKKEYINEAIKYYKDRVKLQLRFLDDFEFQNAINASDIIILPYRYEFDGASGPLAESTMYKKEIIASNHGSLGKIVNQYHLGETFETENSKSLALVIEKSFREKFIWDEIAEKYRISLTVENFQEKYKELYDMIKGEC